MYKQLHTKLDGYLINDIGSTTTYIEIDPASAAVLQSSINFNGGDWTYILLDNDSYTEELKVLEVNSGFIVVERAQSDSTAQAFAAADTFIRNTFGKAAVEDSVAQAPQSIDFTLSGTGLATVTGPANSRIVDVQEPTFTGENGVEVAGSWPSFIIGLAADVGGCCPGEGTSGGSGTIPTDGTAVVALQLTSTILQGSINAGTLALSLTAPTFTGLGGISVGGVWPNYTIDGTGVGGGGGGITVAVGTGLNLTGNPSVNPTISLANTGVTAGDYGGFIVNAQGQITGLPADFSFITSVALTSGGAVSIAGGAVTIDLDSADVAIPGIIAIADSATLSDSDDSTAVTPAILLSEIAKVKGKIAGSMSGEAAALYTNTLSSSAITLTLAAGEKAIIMGEVCVMDGTAPLTPVAYGMGIYALEGTTTIEVYASKICTQSKQSGFGVLNGPFTGSVAVVTTALPSGATVLGAHTAMVKGS